MKKYECDWNISATQILLETPDSKLENICNKMIYTLMAAC
jgi:hypothetical protein